ncbi:uncharacterized protein LOC118529413 [Halichoerus grypus]
MSDIGPALDSVHASWIRKKRKLRLEEAVWISQGHPARKWQSWDSNPQVQYPLSTMQRSQVEEPLLLRGEPLSLPPSLICHLLQLPLGCREESCMVGTVQVRARSVPEQNICGCMGQQHSLTQKIHQQIRGERD